MKRIFTFISLMFFAFSIVEAQQNNISLNEFKTQNPDLDHFHSIDNHHYFIKDELISWTDAKNYGDQIGVSMYIINSSDEENEVYTNLPLSGNNGFGYLIGLYQDTNDTSYSEPDGGWKWIDGTSLTYSNWETNEPNNANNGEDYAHFDWQGGGVKWNDIASSPNVNKAIYEFVDYSADILLNGTVSAENNQIKNVADPTHTHDAATKGYVDNGRSITTVGEGLTLVGNGTEQDPYLISLPPGGSNGQVLAIFNGTPTWVYKDNLIDCLTTVKSFENSVIWSLENACHTNYSDGTPIPQITDYNEWANLTTGAWAYHDNDSSKGIVYNWYAVMGIHDNDPSTPNKKFAPQGWHVPSSDEWIDLIDTLISLGYNYDGSTIGNKIAQSMAADSGWKESVELTQVGDPGYNQSENNSSLFNAIPKGGRNAQGIFGDYGYEAVFWTSTEIDNSRARNYYINYLNTAVNQYDNFKQVGLSVRLIRD